MNRRQLIQSVIAALSSILLIKPAQAKAPPKTLLLLETTLAGFQFYEGESLFPQLQTGDQLTLKRTPQNRYDENAIEVYWNEQQLGHIPRKANVALAQMMDRGEHLTATISTLQQAHNPWQRIGAAVYRSDKS